ncbi:MAG: AAA family ATPase [Rhizobiales bacterium]|nr:AAA family ATPase [Hyphomicrobiales bacterium]
MKNPQLVATKNVERLMSALSAVQQRGAVEACLLVVDGEPGLGKTYAASKLAVENGWVYLRAKKAWTPSWMLRELLEDELRVAPERSFAAMFRQALGGLGERMKEGYRRGRPFALVIDEVDHVVRSGLLLETIRDLSDAIFVPTILVGMGRVRSGLGRFPQVASRVGQYVGFERATVEDVRLLADELAEVPIADDLVAALHRAAGGLAREIMEGIASIERQGRRTERPITVADMRGKPLLNDRKTGRAVVV